MLAYLWLAGRSTGYGEATLTDLLSAIGVTTIVVLGLFVAAHRGAIRLSIRDVIGFAIIFRAVGLLAYPVLEDDFFRYLWDGWQTVSHGTPYGTPPADSFASESVPERWAEVLDGINYPEVATVYGPTAQLLFALSALITPAQVWLLQGLAGAADLGIIWLLRHQIPAKWLLMYSWSPLLIKEFAFTAHIDVIGAFLVMAALTLRMRPAGTRPSTVGIAVGALLALACGIKVFALLAVPFLLQGDWRGWVAFALTACGLGWPFGMLDAWFPAGLAVMGSDWLFNAPLYYSAAALWGWDHLSTVRVLGLSVLAIVAAVLFLRSCGSAIWPPGRLVRRHPILVPPERYLTSLTVLFGSLMFALPVLNPWYLVWWLALAALRPSVTAWTMSAVVVLSYVSGINLDDASLALYEQPAWVLWLQFSPVAIALIVDGWRARRSGRGSLT